MSHLAHECSTGVAKIIVLGARQTEKKGGKRCLCGFFPAKLVTFGSLCDDVLKFFFHSWLLKFLADFFLAP